MFECLGRGFAALALSGRRFPQRAGKESGQSWSRHHVYLPRRIPAVEGSLVSGRPYFFTYGDYLAIKDEAKSLRTISPVLNREDIRAVSEFGSTNGQGSASPRVQQDPHRSRRPRTLVQRRRQHRTPASRRSGWEL